MSFGKVRFLPISCWWLFVGMEFPEVYRLPREHSLVKDTLTSGTTQYAHALHVICRYLTLE